MNNSFVPSPRAKTYPAVLGKPNVDLILQDSVGHTENQASSSQKNLESSYDGEPRETIIDPSPNQQPSLGASTPIITPFSVRSLSPAHGRSIIPLRTTLNSSEDHERGEGDTIQKTASSTSDTMDLSRAIDQISITDNSLRVPPTHSGELALTQAAPRGLDQVEEVKNNKTPFWTWGKGKGSSNAESSTSNQSGKTTARRTNENNQMELTRVIGYLTGSGSEDWLTILEACERASANEKNAKEAVKALQRELRHGKPLQQFNAAKLWALMLRNSTEHFIRHSTSDKFLNTIEDLILSPKTSPLIRERLLDIVAAAAYASGDEGSAKATGFRGLWKRVKPLSGPDEGIPFEQDNAIVNPPPVYERSNAAPTYLGNDPIPIHEPSPLAHDPASLAPNSTCERHKSAAAHDGISS